MTQGSSRRAFLGAGGAIMAAQATTRGAVAQPVQTTGDTTLAYRSVGELRGMLDARQVSAAELVEQAIGRIESRDTAINAVVVRDFERARAAARAADAALARGERRPLLGIPMTVKEAFNVAGLPTTWGLPMFRDFRPAQDAVAVARLKAAGAVILGKTNVPVMLADWQSFNPVYGTTNNPWDVTRTPGGSSGGSAAALAAGYVALELGSDLNGSLRAPAHFCGVFSHKPSRDLVPERGHDPPRAQPAGADFSGGFTTCGPLARNAADLALALDLLAGPDEDTAGAYRLSLPPPRHTGLRGFRVLVLDSHPLLPVAGVLRTALDGLAGRLTAAGASVARASPLLPDLTEVARLQMLMVMQASSFGRPPAFYRAMAARVAALPQDDRSLVAWRLRALVLSHGDWMVADVARAGLRRQWRALFQDFDVVLCPPHPVLAFPQNQQGDRDDRRIEIDGQSFPYDDQMVWNGLATLVGLPATVMPIGVSQGGLPIGVQIIGPFLEDRTTLAFAALLEQAFGGFARPPGMDG